MLRGVKKGIVFTFSMTVGILSITLAAWGIITFWGTMPKYTTYEIMGVQRTTETYDCDTPFVTILKDVTTKTINYKCGDLGRAGRICRLVENRCE